MWFCMACAWTVAAILVAAAVATTLIEAWWRPRRLERLLRGQGLSGTQYRFPFGDLRDVYQMTKEAGSKPMALSHNITPRVWPFYLQATKEYGEIYFTWNGSSPRVIVIDPELIKDILNNKLSHFEKPKLTPPLTYLICGLADYNGEKWFNHRRIANPAFHQERLRSMMPAIYASCMRLVERWKDIVDSEEDKEIDVCSELHILARDVISQTAFGSRYEEVKRLFQLLEEQIILVSQALVFSKIPGYRFIPTKSNRRSKQVDKEVRELFRGIIEKRLVAMKSGVRNYDLLGFLLESNLNEVQENGKPRKAMLTIDEVILECKLFYSAGQETTMNLLSWTMILLGLHPEWQQRAREEVMQVTSDKCLDFESLNQLKIVTMILHEVLRLYPPATYVTRVTSGKESKLGKHTLPAGMNIMLPVLLVHHHPKFWGEDVHEFNPGRFAEGVSKAARCQNVFFPFGGGPRICIGQTFTMIEAKTALAMILKHFSFKISPSYAHAPHQVFTLLPKLGAPVLLRRL